MAQVVRINGVAHAVRRMRPDDVAPGTLVKPRMNRNVYRILCTDGADAVVRNVRTPSILMAIPLDELGDYLFVST